jgi:hypothetical protein
MEDSEMRASLRILLLTSLLALLAVAAGLAQAPQAPAAPQAVPTVAEFLATLSSAPGEIPGTAPAPKLASTICHTNADCGPNALCCYPCGVPDCNFVCMKVKRCPLIP